jgi:hypothetical protein
VLEVVRRDVPAFLIHDGWVTKERVDLPTLIERIKEETGFTVRIKEEQL